MKLALIASATYPNPDMIGAILDRYFRVVPSAQKIDTVLVYPENDLLSRVAERICSERGLTFQAERDLNIMATECTDAIVIRDGDGITNSNAIKLTRMIYSDMSKNVHIYHEKHRTCHFFIDEYAHAEMF